MDTVKSRLERRERELLSPRAALSACTLGRREPASPDDLRTEFQRDRDRILHSKAFRRLSHKTQVFLCPEDDHYRTRLTHTLEVAQVARTIARGLFLNEDLTEAVALGHDLGHTPFGHAGERVLRRCFSPDFAHYKQSLRVVDLLERLNLTYETRDGILRHAGEDRAGTLEGQVVKLADRIAYINHDIDDALRAGVIASGDLPRGPARVLGETHGQRIETMVRSVIAAGTEGGEVKMEREISEASEELRAFLFESVYTNPAAKGEEAKAEAMLEQLYDYFAAHPERIPPWGGEEARGVRDPARKGGDGRERSSARQERDRGGECGSRLSPAERARILEVDSFTEEDTPARRAADFLSGMTDRYAITLYRKLFIPEVFVGGGIYPASPQK